MSDLETLLAASIEVAKLREQNRLLRDENDRIRAQVDAIKDLSLRLKQMVNDVREEIGL